VASGAEDGRVGQYRFDCGWVCGAGVLDLRAVASFAVNMRVLSLALLVDNLDMAGFTGVVPSKPHRESGNFANGCTPVVAVLAKASWHYVVAHHKKHYEGEDEDPHKPE